MIYTIEVFHKMLLGFVIGRNYRSMYGIVRLTSIFPSSLAQKHFLKHFNQIRNFRGALTAIFIILCPMVQAETLQTLLSQAQSERVFQTPSQENLTQAQALFKEMFKGNITPETKTKWTALNFDLIQVNENKKNYLVVAENKSHRKGRGFFVFSIFPIKCKIALQFPHSFKDLYTGKIGLKLMKEGVYAGAAWNTVPRRYRVLSGEVNADFSDLYNTYFASFARAFAEVYPDGCLIQIHGYAKNKRNTSTGKISDIIISTGNASPGRQIISLDTCLEKHLDVAVSLYPVEIMELGATQTSIGIILNQIHYPGFIHIEMSKEMRSQLQHDEKKRGELSHCFQELIK